MAGYLQALYYDTGKSQRIWVPQNLAAVLYSLVQFGSSGHFTAMLGDVGIEPSPASCIVWHASLTPEAHSHVKFWWLSLT